MLHGGVGDEICEFLFLGLREERQQARPSWVMNGRLSQEEASSNSHE